MPAEVPTRFGFDRTGSPASARPTQPSGPVPPVQTATVQTATVRTATDGVPEAPGVGETGTSGPPPMLGPNDVLDLHDDDLGGRVERTLRNLDDDLIGLDAVKSRVAEIGALLMVDRARQRFGLASTRPTLHMSFTGGPGTGKTTVAQRMAQLLHALGYLRKPTVHTVTRDDLVGQFIGHTAPKTKEAIAKAAGGILFIDEAYYLFRPENERDYGQEAIEILLQEMESHRDSLVVIFAGYADRMETFFSANPGLSSRVPHHIEFADYTHDELMQIADVLAAADQLRFDAAGREAFADYLHRRMARPRFSNARSVRNAIERCRLRQAKRLVDSHRRLRRDDLITITATDVTGSSLFADPAYQGPDGPLTDRSA